MEINEILNSPEVQKYIQSQKEQAAKDAVQEATNGLIEKRDQLLAEKKKLKGELDLIKETYDFNELETLKESLKKAQQEKMTVEERLALHEKDLISGFTKERESLQSKFSEETNSLKTELERKDKALRKNLVDAVLSREIANANGIPELLMPILRDKIGIVEDGEEYSARVFEGKTQRIGDSKGNPMTIAQLVEEYKANPIYGVAFKASGATGGDAKGNDRQEIAGGIAPKRSEMSISQKVAYIEKYGQEKFEKLEY